MFFGNLHGFWSLRFRRVMTISRNLCKSNVYVKQIWTDTSWWDHHKQVMGTNCHGGLEESARVWDGTGCEFDSWLCRIYIISHVHRVYDYLVPFRMIWVHMVWYRYCVQQNRVHFCGSMPADATWSVATHSSELQPSINCMSVTIFMLDSSGTQIHDPSLESEMKAQVSLETTFQPDDPVCYLKLQPVRLGKRMRPHRWTTIVSCLIKLMCVSLKHDSLINSTICSRCCNSTNINLYFANACSHVTGS